ncbi:MAG: menaquinone biosynthesis protein [Sedimentisphaerales bacterium]|nr:menaquinone biosynthesis protein [Sedimentisphaerales bacterium]
MNNHTLTPETIRVGAVSFFNGKPLIYGLQARDNIDVITMVPSDLGRALDAGDIDVGLVPSIDYLTNSANWQILPVSAIGSRGEVLTVRVFSQINPEDISQLTCDTDSHTSVVLARIIWRQKYQKKLKITPLQDIKASPSVLLIGDKVIPQLGKWPYELDLGQIWAELTALPFVYAFWAVKSDLQAGRINKIIKSLRWAYRNGVANIDRIALEYGPKHGFEPGLARQYLTRNIYFEFGDEQLQAIKKFYDLAGRLDSDDSGQNTICQKDLLIAPVPQPVTKKRIQV